MEGRPFSAAAQTALASLKQTQDMLQLSSGFLLFRLVLLLLNH